VSGLLWVDRRRRSATRLEELVCDCEVLKGMRDISIMHRLWRTRVSTESSSSEASGISRVWPRLNLCGKMREMDCGEAGA
jgi:hypothetical protein